MLDDPHGPRGNTDSKSTKPCVRFDPHNARGYPPAVLPLLLTLTLGLSPSAAAQEADPTPDSEQQGGFEALLNEATSAYIGGDLPHARTLLLRLVRDPDLSPEELQEARIWLGEVEYMIGEREAARSTFRTVLLYEPGYRMDDFAHPPEVVAFFEATRAELKQPTTPLDPPPDLDRGTPLPLWLALSLPGSSQWHNGHRGLAVMTASGVALTAGGTFAMRRWLVSQDQLPDVWGIDLPESQVPLAQRVKTTQFLVASAGIALHAGTVLGGRAVLRSPSPASFALAPMPGGAAVHLRVQLR